MCKCLSVHMNIYQQGGGFLQFKVACKQCKKLELQSKSFPCTPPSVLVDSQWRSCLPKSLPILCRNCSRRLCHCQCLIWLNINIFESYNNKFGIKILIWSHISSILNTLIPRTPVEWGTLGPECHNVLLIVQVAQWKVKVRTVSLKFSEAELVTFVSLDEARDVKKCVEFREKTLKSKCLKGWFSRSL